MSQNGEKMAKDRIIDGKHLKDLRKTTNLTQKQFAELVNINVRSLRAYESNQRGLTSTRFREIKNALGYVSAKKDALRVMIDYLRITFKDVRDLAYFTETYLLCDLKEFVSEDTKLMAYNHLWRRGDIWIFDYVDKNLTGNYQITVQMSGQGCRQMELILENHNKSWHDLLSKMIFDRKDMKVTRLDVAMDEMYQGQENESEHFLLSEMITKVYHNEVIFDKLKSWSHIGGGGLGFQNELEKEEYRQGISLYFGSRQSNLYFNFYEKRYEIAKKEKMSLIEALEVFGIWNRYELRFAQEKAHKAVEEYVYGVDLAEIAKGIINNEIQVYGERNSYGAFLPDRKWQRLFGGVEPMKLSVQPEPYSIGRTISWLTYAVSNSWLMVSEYDKLMNTNYIQIILDSGEITDKERKILETLKRQSQSKSKEELLAHEV